MLGIFSISYGQYGSVVDYRKETWGKVKKSKIYVVFEDEGNSDYDKALKEAITTNWDFSPVEFINYSKYEALQKDESNYFMLTVDFTKSEAGRYDMNLRYTYIISGYEKGAKKGDISKFPQLAALQTGENTRETYMPLLIKHLNKKVKDVYSGKVQKLGDNTKMLNDNRGKIKTKPLYILEGDLNDKVKSVEDIKSGYSGEVYVVSQEELAKKIKSQEDINVFFCARSSTKSFVHIYNAKTGVEYYNSFNLIAKKWPAGIIPYHYKKWNK